jgi:cytochrome c oxidase cbb3-type subunit III
MSDERPDGHDPLEIKGHEYDGIRELDNPLPGWWLSTFYLTIGFSALYLGFYWFGPGESIQRGFERSRLEAEIAALSRGAQDAVGSGLSDEVLLAAYHDEARKKGGSQVYAQKCASCHGSVGQGGIGPNLADRHWLHGGKLRQIALTVEKGVLDKGMPPWGTMLSPDELKNVVGYVKSLQGSDPAGAKAPQGVEEKE